MPWIQTSRGRLANTASRPNEIRLGLIIFNSTHILLSPISQLLRCKAGGSLNLAQASVPPQIYLASMQDQYWSCIEARRKGSTHILLFPPYFSLWNWRGRKKGKSKSFSIKRNLSLIILLALQKISINFTTSPISLIP